MIRLSLRTNASLHDQQPIDDYSPLGYTRRPVLGEWDDPTEFRACVDPNVGRYDTAGRFDADDYSRWDQWKLTQQDDRVTDQP